MPRGAHASLYVFLDVVVSGVFAWLFLDERFGPLRIAGTVVVLLGLHAARSAARPAARSRNQPVQPGDHEQVLEAG